MNARLCSLLVAGGAALVATQHGPLQAASAAEVVHRASTLQGMNLDVQSGIGTHLSLLVPGFQGKPKVQFLTNPDRVVVDLPGVIKGAGVGRRDLSSLDPGMVVRSRLAQFTLVPEPVTRLVLEIMPGTKVDVSVVPDQVNLHISAETGTDVSKDVPIASTPSSGVTETETVASLEQPFSPIHPDSAGLPEIANPGPLLTLEALPVSAIDSAAPSAEVVKTPEADPAPAVLAQGDTLPAEKSIQALKPVPTLNSPGQGLPGLSLSSLLPTTIHSNLPLAVALPAAQDAKKEAAPAASTRQAGRTLGEGSAKYTGARMSIDVQGADLVTFLRILADAGKLNLIVDQDISGSYTFKFTDTPWDQILDLVLKNAGLGKEIQNGVLRVAKVERLQKEENERKALEEAKSLGGATESVYRPLSYAKVSEAKAVIEKILTKRGSILLDERTNTLIITDLPKNLTLIDDLIATLDVQIQQVQIEAKVVEASNGYEKAFGVKWPTSNTGNAQLSINGSDAPWGFGPSWNSASNRPSANSNPFGVSFTPGAPGVTDIAGAAGEAWVSFISERLSINFILQALEKEGKVKIVSSPKLVTQNNRKAKILSGEKIPYPSQQGGAAGGAITVAFASANLELDVTPQITSDGTIILDIKIEKAEADFSRTVQGTPTILNKSIETQVLVRDGGTAVLGGVYSQNKSNGWTGVPFLSKLPIIGGLFRTRSTKDQNTELLIFITPRIIKN